MREDYVADREVLKVRQDLAEEQFGTREQQWQRGEAAAAVWSRRQQQEVSKTTGQEA